MNKGKIVVVGANQGALAFACFAAESGFDVTLYEQKNKNDVAYDWADELVASTFEKLGIERPPKVLTGPKPQTILVSPDRKNHVTIPQSPKEADIPVDRHQLNDLLYKRAVKAGAKIIYNCAVKGAIYESMKICGIVLENGEEIRTDLVVDCGGAESVVRSTLPEELHIPQRINPDDMFFVRRTYFERAENSREPEIWRRIYLRHMNERGISWCWLSLDEKMSDVLIGRLGRLDDETHIRAVDDLRKDNEILGTKVIKGGQLLKIPIRHNISRMVANGYALVGDSAYMTIPMIGSGMANSMTAAKMLCDVIAKPLGNPYSVQNLYRYQYKYIKEIGGALACVELFKNYALNESNGEIDFLMSQNVVSDSLLQDISGELNKIPAGEIFKSITRGMKKPSVMGRLAKLVVKMGLLIKTSKAIPEHYNDKELCKWQKKYDGFFVG